MGRDLGGSNWASSGVFASAAAVAYIARGVQLLASSRQSFGPSAKKKPVGGALLF